jgi:predicted RND superfamily exporter protein
LLITLAAAFPLRQLYFDNTPESWLPADSPGLEALERFHKRFGDDSFLFAYVEGENLSRPLEAWQKLTKELSALDGIATVYAPPFVEEEGADLDYQGPRPPLVSYLVSEDERYAAFAILPEANLPLEARAQLVERLQALFARAPEPLRPFRLAGTSVLTYDLDAGSRSSLSTLGPLVALALCLVLYVTTKEWRAVLAGLLVIVLSSAWSLALLALFHRPLNLVVAILPAVLAVVTVTQAMHILSCFHCLPAGTTCAEAWRKALRSTLRPNLLCALTTAAGFGGLATSAIPPVRDLGIFAGLGVIFVFVLSFTLFPCCLLLSSRVAPRGLQEESRWTPGRAQGFTDWLARRRTHLLLFAGALFLLALTGVARIRPESHILEFFPADHRIPQNYRAMEKHLLGLTPVDIVFAGQREVLLSDQSLRAYRLFFTDVMHDEPLARQVVSILLEPSREPNLEFVMSPAELREAIEEEDLPETAAAFFRMEGKRAILRTTLLTATESTNASYEMIERLKARLARADIPAGVESEITGSTPLLIEGQMLLLETQIQSFAVALAVITVAIWIAFRSLRAAALALIPNLFPIALTLGYMGWAGIPLNTATVTVAGIALGLIVDDTIHFLHHYLRHSSHKSEAEAVAETLFHLGRPATITSIAVACGFALFAFSSFLPTAFFGLLIGITAVSAWVCAMFVLPAILLRRKALTAGGMADGHTA